MCWDWGSVYPEISLPQHRHSLRICCPALSCSPTSLKCLAQLRVLWNSAMAAGTSFLTNRRVLGPGYTPYPQPQSNIKPEEFLNILINYKEDINQGCSSSQKGTKKDW